MERGFRHEYKYLISAASARLLKARLPHIMHRDSHTGLGERYTIRSLYFDDSHRTAYEEKMDGICDRVKYRIRYYNDDPTFIRLEKKEKHNDLTKKTGQTITQQQAQRLQKLLPVREGLAMELHLNRQLRPSVLVEYDRTPFVCSAGNTRVTLDENLRTRPCCTDLFASSAAMLPVLEPGQVILEVKFDDYMPKHLAAALSDIPKHAMAISKYALCMQLSEIL